MIYIQTHNNIGAYNGSFDINNSTKTIQISKPYDNNQENTKTGYGKWIDNSQNLVKIECYIDDVLKQYITYRGFNTTSSNAGTAQVINENSNSFQLFFNQTQSDIYSGDNNRKGFRIKGDFKLNDIDYTNIISAVGAAQATAHTIKYKYIRDTDVDDTPNMEVSNDVYIDTLTNDPYVDAHTESATVKSVIWTMGIPSVKTFDVSLSRTYKYINSTNKFIPGNRVIAKIKDIRKTNKTEDKSIVLSRTSSGISGSENKAIDSGGEYAYTTAEFGVATSNYYDGAYYDEAIGITSTNSTLTIDEQMISLKKEVDLSLFSISVNHFLIEKVIIIMVVQVFLANLIIVMYMK